MPDDDGDDNLLNLLESFGTAAANGLPFSERLHYLARIEALHGKAARIVAELLGERVRDEAQLRRAAERMNDQLISARTLNLNVDKLHAPGANFGVNNSQGASQDFAAGDNE